MLYDAEIRDPLVLFLEEKYGKIRILDEIPIGKSSQELICCWLPKTGLRV